jgi:ribosomal protein S18 acetylase RimI-like enzyme
MIPRSRARSDYHLALDALRGKKRAAARPGGRRDEIGGWRRGRWRDIDQGVSPAEELPLDNPVYAALCGAHARFAHVRGRARRYPVDVAPFLALPSIPSAQDWRDAGELVAPGTFVAVRHGADDLPDDWQAVQAFDLVQMVGEQVAGGACSEAVALGAADVPEMIGLVEETEPGPFLTRTIELGEYLGVRREGALVAMAGERLRLDGWTEISAVCTAAAHRGQGLASRLVGALIASIQRRSERVFLHVLSTNTGAIRLYEELGFRIRQSSTLTVVTRRPRPDLAG